MPRCVRRVSRRMLERGWWRRECRGSRGECRGAFLEPFTAGRAELTSPFFRSHLRHLRRRGHSASLPAPIGGVRAAERVSVRSVIAEDQSHALRRCHARSSSPTRRTRRRSRPPCRRRRPSCSRYSSPACSRSHTMRSHRASLLRVEDESHRRRPRPDAEFEADRKAKNEELKEAGEQPLLAEEFIGGRLYSGPMYMKYTTPRRSSFWGVGK